jgi:uncharacterized protein (TIGR02453 family)
MVDTFANLIPDAQAFLVELSANNNRDWFNANKATYESTLKAPALLLIDQVAHDLGRQSGQVLRPKLFRPHRDVRFSKDKTPYHTHLHMLWKIGGTGEKTDRDPALFLGISPDYVRIGGGMMGFDKTTLPRWRALVDGDFGDHVQAELDTLAAQGLTPNDPPLKRVPSPFAKDHRHGALLRRKGLAVWGDLSAPQTKAPQLAMSELFQTLVPLMELMQDNL